MKRRNWHAFGIMIAVGAMLGCASTRHAETVEEPAVPQADAALAAYDDLAVLTEALLLVQRHYVEEVPLREMIYGAIDGMLLGLDPNSSFLPPAPLAELEEETRGSFSGIGVTVGLEKEGVKVIAPMEDSGVQSRHPCGRYDQGGRRRRVVRNFDRRGRRGHTRR